LLAKFRIISIDRPSFGYNRFGEAKNLQEQSNIISPLLKYIDNKKPMYIIEHSLVGPLAIKLAADNPTAFAVIVLLAASVDSAMKNSGVLKKTLFHSPNNLLQLHVLYL
jgi:pimeloyl-ACP methyl ester carboxylesterase